MAADAHSEDLPLAWCVDNRDTNDDSPTADPMPLPSSSTADSHGYLVIHHGRASPCSTTNLAEGTEQNRTAPGRQLRSSPGPPRGPFGDAWRASVRQLSGKVHDPFWPLSKAAAIASTSSAAAFAASFPSFHARVGKAHRASTQPALYRGRAGQAGAPVMQHTHAHTHATTRPGRRSRRASDLEHLDLARGTEGDVIRHRLGPLDRLDLVLRVVLEGLEAARGICRA